jgi:hypothetical protein
MTQQAPESGWHYSENRPASYAAWTGLKLSLDLKEK